MNPFSFSERAWHTQRRSRELSISVLTGKVQDFQGSETQRLASCRKGWDNSERASWKKGHLKWAIEGGHEISLGRGGGGRPGERRDTGSQEETRGHISPALRLNEMLLMLLAEIGPARAALFSARSLPAPTTLTFHVPISCVWFVHNEG